MPAEKLTTIYSQHTIYLQRLGASEGLKVTPYLESIENDVVSILNKYRKRKVMALFKLMILTLPYQVRRQLIVLRLSHPLN